MCYHIRWTDTDELDWECHATHEAAERRAERLAKPGEAYTIERHEHPRPSDTDA